MYVCRCKIIQKYSKINICKYFRKNYFTGTVTEVMQLEFISKLIYSWNNKNTNLHNIYLLYVAIALKIKLITRAIRYRIYTRSSFKAQA